MNLRTILATAAIAATIAVPLGNTAATAAPLHHPKPNVLAGFCGHHRHTSCVAVADNDGGRFAVRDTRGHLIRFHDVRAIAKYLDRHATACREEDSPACWWNAGVAGNGVGESFFVVGGKREGQGAVFYLGDFA